MIAVAVCPSVARADEPMFAVIRPGSFLVAQRVVADDERPSPRSMSDRGWSTRTNSRVSEDNEAASPAPVSKSPRPLARPNASAGSSKRALAAQSAGGDRRRKSSAFDSSAAPLRRELPKVLRDPPKTRRRQLGW